MITTKYYLDVRVLKNGTAPLKLAIRKRHQSALLLTGIRLRPENWDAVHEHITGGERAKILNSDIARLKLSVEDFLRPKLYAGELADLSAAQIRKLIDEHLNGKRSTIRYKDAYFASTADTGESSRTVADTAWRMFASAIPNSEDITLDRMTPAIAEKFMAHMKGCIRPNSIVTYLSKHKKAWNKLMKEGKVTKDIFAGVTAKHEATRKRDLTLEQLRVLWNAETLTPFEELALDAFKLSFLLRAINLTDLMSARDSDIYNGRLYYKRHKTSKDYSVKLEPEALSLIDKHKGGGYIFNTVYNGSMSASVVFRDHLHSIARRNGLPDVTMYWARHTLASLMFENGVSMDVVSAVLGHSIGARVTMTYVDIKDKQVDKAMRDIIDLVVGK